MRAALSIAPHKAMKEKGISSSALPPLPPPHLLQPVLLPVPLPSQASSAAFLLLLLPMGMGGREAVASPRARMVVLLSHQHPHQRSRRMVPRLPSLLLHHP